MGYFTRLRGLCWIVLMAFALNTIGGTGSARAQLLADMPVSGLMVAPSPAFKPLMMKGIRVYAKEPFKFDLLVDKGDSGLSGSVLQHAITRLSRFFVASLAVPDEDLWVNLSPYEKDRIIPDVFATTDMGKVLLEQDYWLKQAAATLTYPEKPLGARFWKEVYRRVYEKYGTRDVPMDMANRVWIVPAAAGVYTRADSVFITNTALDVLTDADYQAWRHAGTSGAEGVSRIYTDVFREIILPELRRQVNEDRLFAPVRQVYTALVLATWYKRHWAQGALGTGYVGRNKVAGIDDVPLAWREKLFNRYVRSMHDGVYAYIREEEDPVDGGLLPRKYFSGGVVLSGVSAPGIYVETSGSAVIDVGMDMVRAPLELMPAKPASALPGKTGRLRRFLKTGVLAVLLALGGLASLPQASEAAVFTPSADGRSTLVQLAAGETYGQAIEQMRVAFKEVDPQAYSQSSLAGAMWGKDGVVSRVSGGQDVRHVAAGTTVLIKASIPQDLSGGQSGVPGRADYKTAWIAAGVLGALGAVGWGVFRRGKNVVSEVKPVKHTEILDTVDLHEAMRQMVADAKGEPPATELMAMDDLLKRAEKQLDGTISGAGGTLPAVGIKKGIKSLFTMNNLFNALLMGFWTADLGGIWQAGAMIGGLLLSWLGSGSPQEQGILRCGILGLLKFTPQGEPVRDTGGKFTGWMESMAGTLEDRGGQQMGMFTFARANKKAEVLHGVKVLKNKRGLFFRNGSFVFYPDVVGTMVKKAVARLPFKARSLYNFGRGAVAGFVAHVRFATGGEIVQNAAHPHKSPMEVKKIYNFDVEGNLVSAMLPVQVVAGHNGDNNGVRMGNADGDVMDVAGMRRFFPAAVYMRYEGPVTARYLKKHIAELLPEHYPRVDYRWILRELEAAGYVMGNRVSCRFKGLDHVWRKQFIGYDNILFSLIESALYGLPPGDSPVLPLEARFFMTQGDWDSSLRYAHYMVGHPDGKGLQEDLLYKDEQVLAGTVIERVFDEAKAYLVRPSYKPGRDEKYWRDCWFADEESARRAGAGAQRLILDKFEELLAIRMRQEIKANSVAGQIFSRWETRWQEVYGDADKGRGLFIATMVRKFFTADREHAVRELALRSDGTYGVFVRASVGDDGVTVLCDQQDVAIGFNRDLDVFAFASDPRALKTQGPNGEHLTDVLHLRDGEVADLRFTSRGKFMMGVWRKEEGVLSDEQVTARVYPVRQDVFGTVNPYYAPPPVKYKNRREMVKEDLEDIPVVLNKARLAWGNARSFNRQSTAYLAERLVAVKKLSGKARLLIVGYDNSYTIADMLKPVLSGLVAGVEVESVDSNDFIKAPDNFKIGQDTVVLVISKSGATFPSNLSAKLLMKLAEPQNVFGMTARIDSVLNTALGQGLRMDDPFTRRIFLTGDFYPSEAPVISEQLLLYQQIHLVLQLAKDLLAVPGNPLQVTMPSSQLERLSTLIVDGISEDMRESVGRDERGRVYPDTWGKALRATGDNLGWNFLRPFLVNRMSDIFVWSVFKIGAPMAGLIALASGGMVAVPTVAGLWGVTASLDWLFTKYIFPFLASEGVSSWRGLPKNGRIGARKLFVSAPSHIAKTQRNFFSRLFANGLASTSPAAIYEADPAKDLVTEHASDVARGDIFLNLTLVHVKHHGAMSLKQATFPKTGALGGLAWLKGRAGHEDVVVNVPEMRDAQEQFLVDATLGQFGLMLAAKVIGVTMSMRASFDGRLWNPGESWSRAGVHTTPTPTGVTPRAAEILAGAGVAVADQTATLKPGGIDFNSRRIVIVEQGSPSDVSGMMPVLVNIPIEGFIPHVGLPVALAPAASWAMPGVECAIPIP